MMAAAENENVQIDFLISTFSASVRNCALVLYLSFLSFSPRPLLCSLFLARSTGQNLDLQPPTPTRESFLCEFTAKLNLLFRIFLASLLACQTFIILEYVIYILICLFLMCDDTKNFLAFVQY